MQMLLRSIEDVVREATHEILAIPNNNANKSRIRIAWPTKGAPDWKINENVTFIRVYAVDEPYNRLKDIRYQNNDQTSLKQIDNYTRVIAVSWVFYGPNSFDDADTLRSGLIRNERLRNNKLHVVYNLAAPMRLPELYNDNWWERTDFTAYFYEEISRESTVPILSGAKVIIKTDKGDEENVDITSE